MTTTSQTPPDYAVHSAFAMALDAVEDLVLIKGDRSRLLWANRAFREYYGLSNEELRNQIDGPQSDPDDTIQYVRDDHEVFTTGRPLERTEPITDAQGVVRYFHTTKSAIRNEQGQIVGTIGFSRLLQDEDATRYVQERDQRKNSISELRTLVKHVPVALAMLDARQRLLAFSDSWIELFQQEGRDLIGEFYDLAHEEILPLQNAIDRALDSGELLSLSEQSCQPPRQTARICDVSIQPWRLDGVLGGAIVLVLDVTALRQSLSRQASLTDEISQFNYRVSHDLVAPIRTVTGLLGILDAEAPKDVVSDDFLRALGLVGNSVERMTELVHSLLHISRIDADCEKEPISLPALIGGLLETHGVHAQEVQVEQDYKWSTLIGEKVRLSQILDNLLSNAFKFRDPAESPALIKVSTRRTPHRAVISIEDNGIGFPSELRERIFRRFERGHSRFPGSGLGLFLVSKHVEKLGWTIQVPHCQKNTRFEIHLPLEAVTS